MNEKNLAAIRAAALALVRQAELAGVVVTIATVPGVPLAMRNYRMEVDVRAGRGGAPVATDLSEQDAGLLEQGASMLEALANDERNRGNDSTANGAECSAHAVRRLVVQMLASKLPPLNNDLIEILGRPNFACHHIALALRAGGQEIKGKAEHEQAAAVHFLLGHYLADSANWWTNARDALLAMMPPAAVEGGAA